MTLLDVLLSSTLFMGTAAASLTVWSGAAQLLATDLERQQRHDRLEAELLAGELLLRAPDQSSAPQESCDLRSSRLAAALLAQPPSPGILRGLERVPSPGAAQGQGAQLLRLRLSLGPMVRERIYHPVAFGGCGISPTAPAGSPAAGPSLPAPTFAGGAHASI